MKRGAKMGVRRSPERIFLETLPIGCNFFSKKEAKHLTALASVCKMQIATEVGYFIHPATLETIRITKVTIVKTPLL